MALHREADFPMVKVGIVQALADCLETVRQGSRLDVAMERYPKYRAQLNALLEVASLIRPLAEDVAPPFALQESIRSHLLELQDKPAPSLLHAGGEAPEANWGAG
jgi:hypothetical protein